MHKSYGFPPIQVINKKDIKGILDLLKSTRLVKLDCSNNEITQIINIPKSLKKLICKGWLNVFSYHFYVSKYSFQNISNPFFTPTLLRTKRYLQHSILANR